MMRRRMLIPAPKPDPRSAASVAAWLAMSEQERRAKLRAIEESEHDRRRLSALLNKRRKTKADLLRIEDLTRRGIKSHGKEI